eukprot:767109-Hanusia_phi.AAC.1
MPAATTLPVASSTQPIPAVCTDIYHTPAEYLLYKLKGLAGVGWTTFSTAGPTTTLNMLGIKLYPIRSDQLGNPGPGPRAARNEAPPVQKLSPSLTGDLTPSHHNGNANLDHAVCLPAARHIEVAGSHTVTAGRRAGDYHYTSSTIPPPPKNHHPTSICTPERCITPSFYENITPPKLDYQYPLPQVYGPPPLLPT